MRNIKGGLTVAAIFFAVSMQAQELSQKVSFAVPSGNSLIKTLENFEAKTGVRLVYSSENLKTIKTKNIKCESISVEDCLAEITKGLPVVFRMKGNFASLKYEGAQIMLQLSEVVVFPEK